MNHAINMMNIKSDMNIDKVQQKIKNNDQNVNRLNDLKAQLLNNV